MLQFLKKWTTLEENKSYYEEGCNILDEDKGIYIQWAIDMAYNISNFDRDQSKLKKVEW